MKIFTGKTVLYICLWYNREIKYTIHLLFCQVDPGVRINTHQNSEQKRCQ
jgi:hypothetical protein